MPSAIAVKETAKVGDEATRRLARGVEDLPGGYVEKVLGYTYETQKGRKRPDFLNQTEVLQQLEQLYAMAPTTATVVIGGVEQEL